MLIGSSCARGGKHCEALRPRGQSQDEPADAAWPCISRPEVHRSKTRTGKMCSFRMAYAGAVDTRIIGQRVSLAKNAASGLQ